jgi:hypothetical protein
MPSKKVFQRKKTREKEKRKRKRKGVVKCCKVPLYLRKSFFLMRDLLGLNLWPIILCNDLQ